MAPLTAWFYKCRSRQCALKATSCIAMPNLLGRSAHDSEAMYMHTQYNYDAIHAWTLHICTYAYTSALSFSLSLAHTQTHRHRQTHTCTQAAILLPYGAIY